VKAAIYVIEEVVADFYPHALLAGMDVINAKEINTPRDMAHDVVGKSYVLHHYPRRSSVFIPRRKQDGEPVLRVRPILFKDITVNPNAARVFQFKQVLHRPMDAGVTWVVFFPPQGFVKVVLPEFDV